jgi:hypothetical protein
MMQPWTVWLAPPTVTPFPALNATVESSRELAAPSSTIPVSAT